MNAPVHAIHIQRRDASPSDTSCGHAHTERWSVDAIEALFDLPFNDLILRAQGVHREHFAPNQVELATLLSIKTGGCPEDCGYCPQSVHYDTGVDATKLMDVEAVAAAARTAKEHGATRFCMGAAWRAPKDRDIEAVSAIVREVKSLGLEACCTLGMLTEPQAQSLKDAGLDYYNHNLDTAPEAYGRVITTRDYQDRLNTLGHVRGAGINGVQRRHRGHGRDAAASARASWRSWPTSIRIRSRCPSTSWCASKARRWPRKSRSTRSNSSARSPWPASRCRWRACACRPAASR